MKAQDKMNEIVNNLIIAIEENKTGLWSKSWIGGIPQNYASKTQYSGFNVISLLFMMEEMNWSSNQFLTFNQIKKIKGAKLKKGSKSVPVFFFKIINKTEMVDGEEKKESIPLLKFYYVYNLDQVEGIETLSNENKTDIEIDSFIDNCNVKIINDIEAYYNPTKNFIGIPKINRFHSSEAYYSTLLHELSHSTGHKTKLDRNLSGKFGSESYAYEECIAELSSMFLCNHLNIKGEEKQAEAYIKGWLVDSLKANPKLLWKISSEAQKVLNFLTELQRIEEVA